MARPTKTNLDYFPFDCDFFEDEKIVAIAGEFGIKGELAAVKLLCAIYRNGYFIEWNDMLQLKLVHQLPGVSLELLNQIVGRLVKWEFFDPNLFNTAKILTSRGIQKRYFEATKRWKRNRGLMQHLLINATLTGVNVAETPVNVTLTPQNKIKIKLNNNPPKVPPVGVGGGGVQNVVDDFDSRIEDLKKSEVRLEAYQKLHNRSREQILAYIDRFVLYVRSCDIKINPASVGSFFNGWLKRELNNDLDDEHRRKIENDKYGIDSNSKKQKNWDTSF